jgi:hypothetical protein
MDFVRGLAYAATTFLLSVVAVGVIDLVRAVQAAGTVFGSSYGEQTREVISIIAVVGPVVFIVAGAASALANVVRFIRTRRAAGAPPWGYYAEPLNMATDLSAVALLEQLADLHTAGLLSDGEFASRSEAILGHAGQGAR